MWKFTNTLLEDQDYIDLINFIYPRTVEKYKDVESKQLLWELIKMELRAKTMSYSQKKELRLKNVRLSSNTIQFNRSWTGLNPRILDQYQA